MKKTVAILVAALLLSNTITAQTRFGLNGNFLITNATAKQDNGNGGTEDVRGLKSSTGFKFGVVAEVPVAESFFFMPELNFVNKGAKQLEEETTTIAGTTFSSKSDNKISLNYLEIPLNFAYKSTGSSGSFFGGLGPVLSYGLSGKSTSHHTVTYAGTSQDTTVSFTVKFDGKKDADVTDDNLHLKGLEIGADVFAGYALNNGLFFKVQYNMALTNANPNKNSSFKPNYFGVGLGYMFGQPKTKGKK